MSINKHKCKNCKNMVTRKNAILCRVCANKEIAKNRNKRVEPKGENRWNFKKERLEMGYITIYNPEHIKANANGRVLRAIIVLEEKIGRKLLKNEVAHHINEIKTDDRPENLQLMTSHEHRAYHINKHRKNNWYLLERDSLGRFIKKVNCSIK